MLKIKRTWNQVADR